MSQSTPTSQPLPNPDVQWHERSQAPIASKYMSTDEIKLFRVALSQSYNCPEEDIEITFERIADLYDEDRDDCIFLRYKLRCYIDGEVILRPIHSRKLPLPDHIKAEIRTKEEEQRNRRAAIGGPTPAAAAAIGGPTPTLRRPPRRPRIAIKAATLERP